MLPWPRDLRPGKYDIVIDVNRDGVYTKGTDFLDNIDSYGFPTAGFLVPQEGDAPVVDITFPTNNYTTESTTEVAALEKALINETLWETVISQMEE